ncbi:AglZ/HisF2 family acetamidino modification protein [Bdellovibrio sp. HCB288]|uniref:AglZ/HisF2 family acetamidino modification protein n=1 Tax=Bdellovibrio sp. HCB288 TaxID=3394355 RepID=UPI0039B544D9
MSRARTRVIPCLLLKGDSLVKSVKFKDYRYIGDPINTVRIFNELEVDELVFLDITASKESRSPNFKLLENIASECFMPLAYGGGLRTLSDVRTIFNIGFEKVVINSAAFSNPDLIPEIVEIYGSQAVVGSIDYKSNIFKRFHVYSNGGSKKQDPSPKEWASHLETKGVGEILLTSIERDGTWNGYDIKMVKEISQSLSVPLIANGGAGTVEHLGEVVKMGGASAVAVGSMVVYQKKDMGVLVNFPDKNKLKDVLG